MSTVEFVEKNSITPTAWSQTKGLHVGFSMSKELYERDLVALKPCIAKHKLKVVRHGNIIDFSKRNEDAKHNT